MARTTIYGTETGTSIARSRWKMVYDVVETASVYNVDLVATLESRSTNVAQGDTVKAYLSATGKSQEGWTENDVANNYSIRGGAWGGTDMFPSGIEQIMGEDTRRISWAKTHSSQTVTISLQASGSKIASPTLSKTFTIPAKPSYAIKYDGNGGTGAPGGQTKWYGEDINLQAGKPTRTGYSFKCWNTKQNGTGTNYNPSQKYSSNAGLTLYAQWNPNPYTVTYNANGGSGAPGPQTKYHGIDLVLTTDVPVRPGYAFKSWNTKQDGSGTNFSAGGTYTVNSAVILYAQWEAFNLIKIYDANGNVHLGKLMVYDENGVLRECSIAVYDAFGNRKYAKV